MKDKSKWTQFMDMHSGGGLKEKWPYIYINAPMEEAKIIFYNRFGHNPERISCTCCGEDYSIGEEDSLEQATAHERNCEWNTKKKAWAETQKESSARIRKQCNTKKTDTWGLYQTLNQYLKNKKVLFIHASKIRHAERSGEIPEQGYVWKE